MTIQVTQSTGAPWAAEEYVTQFGSDAEAVFADGQDVAADGEERLGAFECAEPPLTRVLDLKIRTACSATLLENPTVKSVANPRNSVSGRVVVRPGSGEP